MFDGTVQSYERKNEFTTSVVGSSKPEMLFLYSLEYLVRSYQLEHVGRRKAKLAICHQQKPVSNGEYNM